MYIEDKQWDKLVNESCDIIDSISSLSFPKEGETNQEILRRKNLYYACQGMLQAYVNLNNKPIRLNEIDSVIDSKYSILKWAIKRIFQNKR